MSFKTQEAVIQSPTWAVRALTLLNGLQAVYTHAREFLSPIAEAIPLCIRVKDCMTRRKESGVLCLVIKIQR